MNRKAEIEEALAHWPERERLGRSPVRPPCITMPLHIITDLRPGEPDILTPVRHESLVVRVKGHSATQVRIPSPPGGWTHEGLLAIASGVQIPLDDQADAYLGDVWIGSTEI